MRLSLPSLRLQVSSRGRLILGLLLGVAASVLVAGFLLNRRRRRYRAVTATSSDHHLQRTATFRANGHNSQSKRPWLSSRRHAAAEVDDSSSSEEEEDEFSETTDKLFSERTDSGPVVADWPSDSDDSFHSTLEILDEEDLTELTPMVVMDHNRFYQVGVDKVKRGLVSCRKIRPEMVGCESEADFLAKLYCVRLAFSELLRPQANQDYFAQLGRETMCSFLTSVGSDPAGFTSCYDDLLEYLQDDDNWKVAEDELRGRKVVSMNVYDVALDFVLLDAFYDLEHPPATIVAVLQNRWITAGMKQSALSAAVWSLLKAKRSMLTHRDGFMSRFYDLSYTITPIMAWGFLGTDKQLRDKCSLFKAKVLHFVQCVFSLETVRYTTVHSLADDILLLAQRTAESMTTL